MALAVKAAPLKLAALLPLLVAAGALLPLVVMRLRLILLLAAEAVLALPGPLKPLSMVPAVVAQQGLVLTLALVAAASLQLPQPQAPTGPLA